MRKVSKYEQAWLDRREAEKVAAESTPSPAPETPSTPVTSDPSVTPDPGVIPAPLAPAPVTPPLSDGDEDDLGPIAPGSTETRAERKARRKREREDARKGV